jgi:hypothetical protein
MDLRDRMPKKHFVWATTESLPIGAPSFCGKVLLLESLAMNI